MESHNQRRLTGLGRQVGGIGDIAIIQDTRKVDGLATVAKSQGSLRAPPYITYTIFGRPHEYRRIVLGNHGQSEALLIKSIRFTSAAWVLSPPCISYEFNRQLAEPDSIVYHSPSALSWRLPRRSDLFMLSGIFIHVKPADLLRARKVWFKECFSIWLDAVFLNGHVRSDQTSEDTYMRG